jgi:thiol-disulfide isomerase/thioredoxin
MAETDGPPRRPTGLMAGAVAAGVLLVAAAIYGIGPRSRNAEGACPGAAAVAARLAPLAKGEVAALNVAQNPMPLPNLAFKDADGHDIDIASLRGRTALVNLWATWCVPCRTEMPSLDALQASLGGPDFTVAAINIDQRNTERANSFLDEIKVAHLIRYADPSAKVFADLKGAGLAFGMPTTVILDKQGCVLASLAGPADWASGDAKTFLMAALGR